MMFILLSKESDTLLSLTGMVIGFIVMLVIMIRVKINDNKEKARREQLTPEQIKAEDHFRLQRYNEFKYGPFNPLMVCPHCQTKGEVRSKAIETKSGISGGKATAAVITCGISVLATGLSKKGTSTIALCEHCNSNWTF